MARLKHVAFGGALAALIVVGVLASALVPTPKAKASGGLVAMGFAIGWQMPTTPPWGDITQEDLFALQTTNGTALDTHFLANVNVPQFVADAHAHNVQAMITIGGSSDQNWQNACVGANQAGFVTNLVNYMQSNGFDGIDLDIEDDVWLGEGPPTADMTNCIHAISTAAKAVRTQAGNVPLISGDIITNWAGPWWSPSNADVDQYNLMTYGDTVSGGSYNTDVQDTHNQGIPYNKMVGGIDIIDAPSTSNQATPYMQYAQTNGLLGAFVWDESTDEANGYPTFAQFPPFIGGGGPPPAPAASLSPTSLAFGNQVDGTTSAAQTETLTNSGNAALAISGVSIGGTNAADFAQTNNCPASLAAGASCQAQVTFTPSVVGAESASLQVADNAAGSPQSVPLSGTGVAQQGCTQAVDAWGGATLNPASPTHGQTAVASVAVKLHCGSGSVIVDFQEFNSAGTKLAEQFETVGASSSYVGYGVKWTPGAAASGDYLSTAIFDTNWNLISWNDHAINSFTVK